MSTVVRWSARAVCRWAVAALSLVLCVTGCAVSNAADCSGYRDTRYLPDEVTLARDDLVVRIQDIEYKALAVLVNSSDGRYSNTRMNPTTSIFEGLLLTTKIGFGWVWDPWSERFVQQPGQVTAFLRVYDCWSVVSGPADLW